MLFRLAYKNILADYRRSILTLALSMAATAFLLAYTSMNEASHKKFIADAVEIYTGYLRVQGRGFAEYPDYDHLIFDLAAVQERVGRLKSIKKAAPRFETFALFSGDSGAVSGMLTGIDPEAEPYVSRVIKGHQQGEVLVPEDGNAVYMGEVLARKLKVGVGDTVSYISSGLDYSFAADNVVVKGLFKTGLYEFDATAAFLNKSYMDEMFLSANAASHLILLPVNPGRTDLAAAEVRQALAGLEVEVQTWEEILSAMVQMMEVDEAFGYITLGVFVVVIFFVIMLFTLVSTVARTREIGMIRAIGTSPARVYGILLAEALIIGLAGVLSGSVIGGWFIWYFEHHHIELSGMEEIMQDWGVAYNYIPFEFSFTYIAWTGLFVLALNLLAVLYPAWKVTRYRPIEAINYL